MNRKVAIKNIIVFSLIFLVGIWLLLTLSSKRGESATVKNLSVPKFSKIDVDTSNADIEIKKGDSYKVIYNGKENTIPDIKVKRDTLQITSPTTPLLGVIFGISLIDVEECHLSQLLFLPII